MTPKSKTKSQLKKHCAGCGVEHVAGIPGTWVMPARLGSDRPDAYACSRACHDRWREDEGLPPLSDFLP